MNEEELTDLEKFELIIQDCKEHRRLYNESFVSEDDIEIMETVKLPSYCITSYSIGIT